MKQPPYQAPLFSLPESREGDKRSLSDYKGTWLVLYFYPKDDTPGCTTEACSLRDARDELTDLGADVVGISKDAPESHDKFKTKYNLNFSLLSDYSGQTIEAYDAWGPKVFGKAGIQRKTFLIDPKGIVQKVYGKVTPSGHGDQIIADLKHLQASAGA